MEAAVKMDRDEFLEYFREAHCALHRCWTKAVGQPDYVKADWQAIDTALARFARDYATEIGIGRTDPLL